MELDEEEDDEEEDSRLEEASVIQHFLTWVPALPHDAWPPGVLCEAAPPSPPQHVY